MVRLKTRYILFRVQQFRVDSSGQRVHSPTEKTHKLDRKAVWAAIQASLRENFGTLTTGLLQIRLQLKYYNAATATGILRTNRDNWRQAQGALTYITDVDGRVVSISVSHISGTVKHIEMAALKLSSETTSILID